MFTNVMPNYKFKRLIRPFQLSIYLRIIRRCYKQFGLERSLQTLSKARYKLRILIRYDFVWITLIVQQKLSTKYISPIFYRVSFVSGQKEFPFGSFINSCKYYIENIVTFDRLQYIFENDCQEYYHEVEDNCIYRLQ